MTKSRVKRIRLIQHQKAKEEENKKLEAELAERKLFLALRKKKRKTETVERSRKFFEDRNAQWDSQRNHNNLAVPSIITKEGGKCTKKKSPLDL